MPSLKRHWKWATAVVLVTLYFGCNSARDYSKVPMNRLPPRIAAVLGDTQTVCFGRFMVDIPASAQVSWGEAQVPLRTWVYADQADELEQLVAEREAELKSKARFPRSAGLSLYIETLSGPLPEQKMVRSQAEFDSEGMYRIDSYFKLGPHLVVGEGYPLKDDGGRTITRLNDIGSRLRVREPGVMPTEAGVCLEGAFLLDAPPGENRRFRPEHIRVGFRFSEFPDVHFSIYTAAKSRLIESDELKGRVGRAERLALLTGQLSLFEMSKTLRKGDRKIATVSGYEVLARMPEPLHQGGSHEFRFGSVSAVADPTRPLFDIWMQTGVKGNDARQVASSLSDAEAVALWDRIVSTIRLRPVSPPPPPPNAALGTQHMTGRICPQDGTWQAENGQRRFVAAGQPLPGIAIPVKPTLWQRLRGHRPIGRMATLWTLVSYGPPANPAAGEDVSGSGLG